MDSRCSSGYECIITNYTCNYYPFKDESREQINAEREKIYNEAIDNDSLPPTGAESISRYFDARGRLPFTEAEYEKYQDKTQVSDLQWSTRIAIRTALEEINEEKKG